MGIFRQLGFDSEKTIDWEITPALTYGLFECRGDMEKIKTSDERYYYFHIDNWQKPARLRLMERGLRYQGCWPQLMRPGK
ncbi:MAG: hypothetical protein KKE17_06730 [Proteobacteria bacterium]|nr:hypothetical protein [Pseudomonadota bacterium]MBU1709683.1 hypothetical protein [Pseudomonadota bacterium]